MIHERLAQATTLRLWPVDDDGRCTCGDAECARPGKHPAIRAPGPGYAVITGERSGLFVLDVDCKAGDGYGELEALGEIPETFTVRTGSGGAHFYFRHPGFQVRNRKPSKHIDVKGDAASADGFAYVVGPGSPGYVKTEDPCVVSPADSYEVIRNEPIADAPAWLLAWLRVGNERKEGHAPTPIDVETEEGQRRVRLGVEACKTMPESIQGQDGSGSLWSVALRLVRKLELPLDVARELVLEHFNARCVPPWSAEEIEHKLEDARYRSDVPCGILTEKAEKGLAELKERMALKADPVARVTTASSVPKVGANDSFSGERRKLNRAEVIQILYSYPAWDGVLWFDVLAQKPYATGAPLQGHLTMSHGEMSRGDLALIASWFDVNGMLVSKELVEDALWCVVRMPDRQRNPIAKWLDTLPPVTEASVLPTLATDVMCCTDPFENVLVMKTLVAAARRARKPGTFHKAMLVLKGEQQCGKTPWVKILAGDWYQTTANGNIADRDTILSCQGKWLVEVEELSALNKADADALKTAISRSSDPITKKYEPDARLYQRSFTLIGTTNKDEFLNDPTGSARYWVVEVGQIDLAKLEALREQIWAEADFLARSGMSNELDADERSKLEARNAGFVTEHPWELEVSSFLSGKEEIANATEVLCHLMKGDMTKADVRLRNHVTGIMRQLGCQNVQRWRHGKNVRVWTVPASLATAKAKPKLHPLKGGK